MAEVRPLKALHYNLEKVGSLQDVTAPPYDVIDQEQRSKLLGQSPYNVVEIDLPEGEDRYSRAAEALLSWLNEDIVERDSEPAYWLLTQTYKTPTGQELTRHGIFGRVRVADYAPGVIRPHERTHAGPKEDRLRLTRATKTNLSPIFSLYSDPNAEIWKLAEPVTEAQPWSEVTDSDGTVHRLWRLDSSEQIDQITTLFEGRELLIADGHHRYETALTYAREVGGEGDHQYTMMCLVAMEDPGMTVFPTHRLVGKLGLEELKQLESAVESSFERTTVDLGALQEPASNGVVKLGYVRDGNAELLTLKSEDLVSDLLTNHSAAYRSLNTAVLESLVFKSALGRDQEELAHSGSIAYCKDLQEAVELVKNDSYQAAFLLSAAPMEQIRAIAAAGETMPPKSTYFFPKLLSGMLFSPLE